MKRYHRRTQQFPLSLPQGPWLQLNATYKELQCDVVCPPPRERPANKWITDQMWKIVYKCTMLQLKRMLSQAAARSLGWEIKACSKTDHLLHAKMAAMNVKGCFTAREYIDTWLPLKGWYCLAEDQAPKPCPKTLAKQRRKGLTFMQHDAPRGDCCPFMSTLPPSLMQPQWIWICDWWWDNYRMVMQWGQWE